MIRDSSNVPQINISRIRVDGNVAGAIFVVGSVAICLAGIPGLWSVVVGALLMGGGIAWLLRRFGHS